MNSRGEINLTPFAESLLRFESLLSRGDVQQLREALKKPLLPSIRINPLKTSPQEMSIWREKYGWAYQPIPFCSTGYWLTACPIQPGPTPEHKMGAFYIQDAASMLPVELFDVSGKVRPLILDMAASPGGKTTHLCSRILDQGLIIANDSNPQRIKALELNMQNWGAMHHAITQLSGSMFGIYLPECFDLVLLDAPCSMQGLRSTYRHPLRRISKNEQAGLVSRQIDLLDSSLRSVKVGGQVVYSTCTLSPEENEGVLDALVKRFGDSIAIIDVSKRLRIPPALTEYDGRQLESTIAGAARIWPHAYGTAGFFAALITKERPITARREKYPLPPNRLTSVFKDPRPEDIQHLNEEFQYFLCQPISDIAESTCTEIKNQNQFWYLLPLSIPKPVIDLPIHSMGMCIAESTPDGLLPTHEFLSRFSHHLSGIRLILEQSRVAGWMRGQDLQEEFQVKGNPFIPVTDDRGNFIGRGKCLHNRVRNLLPRHLI